MDATAELRAFNRFYTAAVGALDAGLLRTEWSLTEARLIFELAQHEIAEVADLRRELGMDAGHLSRVLARLEAAGVVERARSAADGRRQTVRLTDAGRAAFTTLDERSAGEVGAMLDGLDAGDRADLIAATRTIRRVLSPAPQPDAPRAVTLRAARPGDLGWVVELHGRVYAEEFGWDATFEALVARVVADHLERGDTRGEAAWIAEVDGRRAGCVLCVREDDQTARLRLLLVDPAARGLGLGTRLVDESVAFARRAGYRAMVLWTNDVLVDARRLYERAGFTLVLSEPHRSFGAELVGQTWRLDL
jgi:DNA-binding MarR family transcriptional regulator/GNAT superfamily N-acetyltransferase